MTRFLGEEPESIPSYCLAYCQQSCMATTLSYEFNSSLVFSILTLLISSYHICMHLSNFNNPFFQSKIISTSALIVVILIMAPFYCITSMGSFMFPSLQIYFTLTRDTYEALLLFVFFYLMFSYLAYDRDQDRMEDKKVYTIMIQYEREVHHFWPFSYCQKPYPLSHWKKAKYFTYRCKKYVLQFLVVKLLTTILMYVIYPNQSNSPHIDQHSSEESSGSYQIISSCVSFIVAISASYSLYYLVLFYHALHKPLAPYSALLKFLTIKITIFFTFWQRIAIVMFQQQLLNCFDKQSPHFNSSEIISSFENTLICFEMLMMAIAGGIAYDYENYVSERGNNQGNFGYVVQDTIRAFKKDFRLIKPKKFGFQAYGDHEVELIDIRREDRQSVLVSVKNKSLLTEYMIDDYL